MDYLNPRSMPVGIDDSHRSLRRKTGMNSVLIPTARRQDFMGWSHGLLGVIYIYMHVVVVYFDLN